MNRLRTALVAAAWLTAAGTAAIAPPSPAWKEALEGAKASRMEKAFAAELEADPRDALAAFALAQAHFANGEREKAVIAAVEGLRRDPKSPVAFLLEDIISDEAFFNSATSKLISDSLPILLNEEGMEPAVRFNLRWLAYRMAARASNGAEREAAQRSAGFLNRAYFAVTKGNLARLDFLRVTPPEEGNYAGLGWQASSWDTPAVRPPLYDTPDDREYNYYALMPFSVTADSEAILYVNGATSFAVRLDGREVLRKDNFSRQENPSAYQRLSLKTGRHALLLKVFASGNGEGVHVALLRDNGGALPVTVNADGPFAAPGPLAPSRNLGPLPLRFERISRRTIQDTAPFWACSTGGWATWPKDGSNWKPPRPKRRAA